jgi:hypothetical protein
MAGVLNPVNDFDLGATCGTCPIQSDNYFVGTLTFSTNAIPIGTYHIAMDFRAVVIDSDFGDHLLVTNAVTINVVSTPPELSLVTAASRKRTFDVNLPLSGEPGVEEIRAH